MLSSPFQQPSRRQNALVLQIQEARTTGDEALLSRLISQWVHRYGFNGAAGLDLSLPEFTVSELELCSEEGAEEPSCAPEILAEENELVIQNEVEVQEEEVLAQDEVVQEGVAEDESVVEDDVLEEEGVAEATELQRSFKPGPVPAPPISTPRSLRRWLPRRENDAFPKAS